MVAGNDGDTDRVVDSPSWLHAGSCSGSTLATALLLLSQISAGLSSDSACPDDSAVDGSDDDGDGGAADAADAAVNDVADAATGAGDDAVSGSVADADSAGDGDTAGVISDTFMPSPASPVS